MKQTEDSSSYYTININDGYYEEKIKVPFSWEYKPGVSKVSHDTRRSNLVLQPPPRSSSINGGNRQLRVEDTEGQKILCAVQPSSLRIRSFRLEAQKGDPFLEAYKKCTQSPKHPFPPQRSNKTNKNIPSCPNMIKHMHILFCKFSGDVVSMP